MRVLVLLLLSKPKPLRVLLLLLRFREEVSWGTLVFFDSVLIPFLAVENHGARHVVARAWSKRACGWVGLGGRGEAAGEARTSKDASS